MNAMGEKESLIQGYKYFTEKKQGDTCFRGKNNSKEDLSTKDFCLKIVLPEIYQINILLLN